ncbi:MAG: ATP-binding protein [Chloroflexi bacterium]|nr:ATP-binding protein [Chloroflexota bacterium]
MLRSLHLTNFTVFPDARFDFGKNLNVIVGENGLGKTHVLKAAYCVLAVSAGGAKDSGSDSPTKAYLQTAVATKLRNVFKPDTIGRLVQRKPGRNRSEVECNFDQRKFDLAFSFNTTSKSEVTIDRTPSAWIDEVPIYLPTRELLTIYPGFVSLYETTHLQFEETWRDTAILLGAPLARGAREKKIRELLKPLEQAMEGSVELDEGGRFYLHTKMGRIEMHLVAEGLRKLAMIARLIATGSLLDKGYLFWDEPDANLNPKLVKLVARTIVDVSQSGIQVFIATHSLFLLRELHILQRSLLRRMATKEQRTLFKVEELDNRFFGLHLKEGGVEVTQGNTMDDIGDISALDEELAQSERYIDTENKLIAD